MPISHLHRPIGLSGLLLAAMLICRQDAAAPSATPVIAFVGKLAEADDPSFDGFRAAMARAWPSKPGAPVLRYYQAGDGDVPRLHATLRDAAAQRPAVLVLPAADAAQAAKLLRIDSPVVFASYPDPLRSGIATSLRRPGRQTTGVWLGDTLNLKRLELLKLAFPGVRTVAILVDGAWLATRDVAGMAADAQRLLSLHLVVRSVDTTEALDQLMTSPEAAAYDAWYIPPTYVAYLAEASIIAHLRRLRLPAIHSTEEEVAQGALMAYSQDTRFAYDAMAELARRVALGEDAGSIPVQRPYRYTLSVRIEGDAPWARIEPSVIRRADRVHRP
jgi:ABC-type uncharacterized transport system substrate-binding protein